MSTPNIHKHHYPIYFGQAYTVHSAGEYSQLAAGIAELAHITSANIFIPTFRPLCTKYRFGVNIKPRPNISHTKSHRTSRVLQQLSGALTTTTPVCTPHVLSVAYRPYYIV